MPVTIPCFHMCTKMTGQRKSLNELTKTQMEKKIKITSVLALEH